jgi:hypothetical protein
MTNPKGPPTDDTARIAGVFSAQLAAARARLTALMESHGMKAAHGWRIHEDMLNTPTGFALRLRPVHRTERAPDEIEEVVTLS